MTTTTPRYPPPYRATEIRQICNFARKGLSLCFVGVAGSGKSNIVNFLRHDPYGYRAQYLGDDNQRTLFPVVDGTVWDKTPANLWKLMIAALYDVSSTLLAPVATPPAALGDDERLFAYLRDGVKQLCQRPLPEQSYQVMFILDDFDNVLQSGPLAMLEHLHTVRNDGNREQLSYLILTKRLPHLLGGHLPLAGKSKFYDLFNNAVYALEMYNDSDLWQMLQHMNDRAGNALLPEQLSIIASHSGGHARLAYLLFHLWENEKPPLNTPLNRILANADIWAECQRILLGLHLEEQAVALRLARGQTSPSDEPLIEHLTQRGLIKNRKWNEWFSPLMAEFLRTYHSEQTVSP